MRFVSARDRRIERAQTLREREIRECPLCSDEPYYVRCLASRSGDARAVATVVNQTQMFQREIFDLERTLSLSVSDETVFQSMLTARQTIIERILDRFSFAYRPWTLATIRRHYDVRRGHRYDPERLMLRELDTFTMVQDDLESSTLRSVNPDDGSVRIDIKVVEVMLKTSKRKVEIIDAIAKMRRMRASADLGNDRAATIVQHLRAAEQMTLGASARADNTRALPSNERVDLYQMDDF